MKRTLVKTRCDLCDRLASKTELCSFIADSHVPEQDREKATICHSCLWTHSAKGGGVINLAPSEVATVFLALARKKVFQQEQLRIITPAPSRFFNRSTK